MDVVGILIVQQRQPLTSSSFVPAPASVAHVCLLHFVAVQAHQVANRACSLRDFNCCQGVFLTFTWSLGGLIYHPSSPAECMEESWDLVPV